MLETLTAQTEDVSSKKRGRKATTTNYFDVREEEAVKAFLLAESYEEKNKIYNDFLRNPLDKMISSIIRRYKLYRKDMDFNEIHVDTHSFLMTKVEKFVPSKEKKAYSYFGTICKNYLMGQILKDQKETNRKISYEDISSDLENNPDLVYHLDIEPDSETNYIPQLLELIKSTLEEDELNENEYKLGLALVDIFDKYEVIFPATDNYVNKGNKSINEEI